MTGGGSGILAGYDGSPDAEEALRWAAREAVARRTALTVCHAWLPGYPAPPGAEAVSRIARETGERILARGARNARNLTGPDAEVRPLLAGETAAVALCQRSAGAEITVVGSRGHGVLAGMPLGSVSSQVAAHAPGPVVVVRGRWRPVAAYVPGSIVVGADGSDVSAAAVRFAFEEAALRDVPLVAACALSDTAGTFGAARQVEDDFEDVLVRSEKANPDVIVHRRVSCGAPRGALLAAASEVQAQLLVVGSRGRGGLKGMALGSVSQAMVQYAPCPVAVVHRAVTPLAG